MLATSAIKKPTESGRFFSAAKTHRLLQRWIAIVITLVVHLLVLWGLLHATVFTSSEEPRTTQLRYITLPPVTDKIEKSRIKESLSIQLNPFSRELLQPAFQQIPELVSELEPLTPQELREITSSNSYSPQGNSLGIARNVFHPGLREKLTIEENRPVLARVEDGDLKTHTDPSGATIVRLGSGNCLKSPPSKPGEARNWYMTACAGKTESEKMLERVDRDVNGNRRFDEPN